MTQIGSVAEWANLLDSQVPVILDLVITTWLRLPPPAANELEDTVTNRLCSALQQCPNRAEYPFHIRSQTVILEPGSGDELGRMDIAFLPFVPSDEIYFCLECKRLNVRTADGIRPYFSEYVRFGMTRFVSGQYSNMVRNGGMLGFVLDGDIAAGMSGVENNIRNQYQALGMDPPGEFQASNFRPNDNRLRETRHRRTQNPEAFLIHHLFMAGDPNAALLPVQSTAVAAGTARVRKSKTRRRARL